MLETKERVIFALVRKPGQTFSELRQSAKTNDNSLTRALIRLKKDNLIKKEDSLYYFSTDIKNHVLLSLKGSYSMVKRLDGFLDELRIKTNPFPSSRAMIRSIIELQIILKLERYSIPKLTKREALEFDLFDDIFNAVLEMIFEILRKKDSKQTQSLKNVVSKMIFNPVLAIRQ